MILTLAIIAVCVFGVVMGHLHSRDDTEFMSGEPERRKAEAERR